MSSQPATHMCCPFPANFTNASHHLSPTLVSVTQASHAYLIQKHICWLQDESRQTTLSSPLHVCWAALLQRFVAAGDVHSVLRALDAASGRDPSGDCDMWLLTAADMEALVQSAHKSGLHGGCAVLL